MKLEKDTKENAKEKKKENEKKLNVIERKITIKEK